MRKIGSNPKFNRNMTSVKTFFAFFLNSNFKPKLIAIKNLPVEALPHLIPHAKSEQLVKIN